VNTEQILACAVIGAMMAAFLWGRLRYDLVAALALLLALALGIVPFEEAFSGFSDDIVIIVGSALVVSAAVSRSGLVEHALNKWAPRLSSTGAQVALLTGLVALLSAFVKNIGALAILIPVAFQFAKRSGTSPSGLLMPMAFASLLGGLMTLVGTSPNVIVSRLRAELTGEPFRMFDFTPVGAILVGAGLVFLAFFHWLLPRRERTSAGLNEAINIKNYLAEARIKPDSAAVGQTVGEFLKPAEGAATVTSIVRGPGRRITPLPDATLKEGDIVLMEGDPNALDSLVAEGDLAIARDRSFTDAQSAEIGAVEAVVGANSSLIGLSAQGLALHDRFGVNLLAVSRQGQRLTERLKSLKLREGDVIVLQGDRERLPALLREFGCLPLAERTIKLGSVRRGLVPLALLGVAIALTTLGIAPVQVTFFGAAVGMVLFRAIPLREVYHALDGPILVMLAALIPVSDSLRRTGATEVAAAFLSDLGGALPGWGALTLILVAAMAVTPFLNNAATVLVMGPIAAGFATGLGYRPDAFLMAVAIGAGCDFLTPIGHQCNTLVMGPGGYKFGDYARLGAPLSLIVILVAIPALMLIWPLR
jgi:di/tricarboxylate transporter